MEEVFKDGVESVYLPGGVIPLDDKVNFIKSGALAVYTTVGRKRYFVFAYKAGEIFEYSRKKRRTLAGNELEFRALSTVVTFSIPKRLFHQKIFGTRYSRDTINQLLGIVELQMERIDNLTVLSTRQKLLVRLLFFAKRLGRRHGDKIVIDAPLSYTDIATSIGAARETVNRLMKELEKQGVVTVKNHVIVINSLPSLRKLIESAPKK